ncbi:hypothetical protein BD309DRAFT_965180 [Dichomitus squalens]|nr:hypothetical protein BD309DRAFT_965180 [Dichomitus squalens]
MADNFNIAHAISCSSFSLFVDLIAYLCRVYLRQSGERVAMIDVAGKARCIPVSIYLCVAQPVSRDIQ